MLLAFDMERNKKYYYIHLTKRQQEVCDALIDSITRYERSVVINKKMNTHEFFLILDVIAYDFPELFYFDRNGVMIIENMFFTEIRLAYLYSQLETEQYQKQLRTLVQDIITQAFLSKTFEERELLLHDDLIKRSKYHYDNLNIRENYTIIGPLLLGKGVCEGYAKAYRYLCEKANILCLVVSGNALHRQDMEICSHAWNIVKLPGKGCFHVDVTWDSCSYHSDSTYGYYTYFNQNDEEMRCDHEWNSNFVPACTLILPSTVPIIKTIADFDAYLHSHLKMKKTQINIRTKKKFADIYEAMAFTNAILQRHKDVHIRSWKLIYIKQRNQIQYYFEYN